MGHGVVSSDGERARTAMSAETVEGIAETLQALGTPSRLRILLHLREAPCPVGELADAVGMEQSAVSHQLRVLRNLGLVTRARQGRHMNYRLHDDHVASLLDEAIHHTEHLRLGRPDVSVAAEAAVPVAPRG